MTDIVRAAVEALNARLGEEGFDGTARFIIEGAGTLIVDSRGARAGGGVDGLDADVTLTADADTFRAILDGDLAATTAFMQGRLSVEGDMGAAMRLGSVLG